MEKRRLVIGQHLRQRILEHCHEEKPNEACGIMTGRNGRVLHGYATDNAKQSPIFFEVDLTQQAVVLAEMQRRGEELLAIYHSHPKTEATPSRNDINMAVHYPDALRVIISLAGSRAEMRAYLIRGDKVHLVEIDYPSDGTGQWQDLRGYGERTGR